MDLLIYVNIVNIRYKLSSFKSPLTITNSYLFLFQRVRMFGLRFIQQNILFRLKPLNLIGEQRENILSLHYGTLSFSAMC